MQSAVSPLRVCEAVWERVVALQLRVVDQQDLLGTVKKRLCGDVLHVVADDHRLHLGVQVFRQFPALGNQLETDVRGLAVALFDEYPDLVFLLFHRDCAYPKM